MKVSPDKNVPIMIGEERRKAIMDIVLKKYPEYKDKKLWFYRAVPKAGELSCNLDMFIAGAARFEPFEGKVPSIHIVLREIKNPEMTNNVPSFSTSYITGGKKMTLHLERCEPLEVSVINNRCYFPIAGESLMDTVMNTSNGTKTTISVEKVQNVQFYKIILFSLPDETELIINIGKSVIRVPAKFIKGFLSKESNASIKMDSLLSIPKKELEQFCIVPF